MKRTTLALAGFVLLVTTAVLFVAPAEAATPCLWLGELYNAAQRCVDKQEPAAGLAAVAATTGLVAALAALTWMRMRVLGFRAH